jgi:hypothetical protein
MISGLNEETSPSGLASRCLAPSGLASRCLAPSVGASQRGGPTSGPGWLRLEDGIALVLGRSHPRCLGSMIFGVQGEGLTAVLAESGTMRPPENCGRQWQTRCQTALRP